MDELLSGAGDHSSAAPGKNGGGVVTAEIVEAIWRYPVKSMAGEEIASSDVTERGLAGDRVYALVDKASNRAAVVRGWGVGLLGYGARFTEEPHPDGPPPAVEISGRDGEMIADSRPEIERRLSASFNRPLALMSQAPADLLVEFPRGTLAGKLADLTAAPLAGGAPAGTFFDVAPIHLIASSTLDHLQSSHPQSKMDVRRFRPNIVVRTLGAPFLENSWIGKRLAIGDDVVLRVTIPCPRCVVVTVEQPGLPKDAGILRAIAKLNRQDLGDLGNLPCAGVYANVLRPGRINKGDALQLLD